MLAEIAESRRPMIPFSADYRQQSRRPFASLIFVLPMLVIYEIGVPLLKHYPVVNGADVMLRKFLGLLGFGQYFLLPLLTICVLLAWHHMTHQPWRVGPKVFYGMLLECIVLAFGLLVIAQLLSRLFQLAMAPPLFIPTPCIPPLCIPTPCEINGPHDAVPLAAASIGTIGGFFAKLVSYCGAGFYEEVLFRLILLPLVAMVLRGCKFTPLRSMIAAGVVTSLVFSAAHYMGSQSDPFTLYSFTFRSLAGIFFSLLFVYRGFGIAVGTHAFYDILTI